MDHGEEQQDGRAGSHELGATAAPPADEMASEGTRAVGTGVEDERAAVAADGAAEPERLLDELGGHLGGGDGLPELEGNLQRRAHRSLLTRIHHRLLIPPASLEDTAEYVRYCLDRAGTDRALFPDDALATLHELSQGALREVDRLATAALREAVRRKKKLVDRDVVTRVGQALVSYE